jgi:hypothetical protein
LVELAELNVPAIDGFATAGIVECAIARPVRFVGSPDVATVGGRRPDAWWEADVRRASSGRRRLPHGLFVGHFDDDIGRRDHTKWAALVMRVHDDQPMDLVGQHTIRSLA